MENQIEVWKDVKNYEGFYKVSNLGRVKSLDRFVSNGKSKRTFKEGVILKYGRSGRNRSYLRVNLNKHGKSKSRTVHQLVVEAFLDENYKKNGYVVDHIDENKENNSLSNLRIFTNRENLSRYKNKTSKYTGVHYHKTQNKWCANIWHDGKKVYLGSFKNELDARDAYLNYLNSKVL